MKCVLQVGLPARGKSYLSNKLMIYLKVSVYAFAECHAFHALFWTSGWSMMSRYVVMHPVSLMCNPRRSSMSDSSGARVHDKRLSSTHIDLVSDWC